jgi:hypothetical protein
MDIQEKNITQKVVHEPVSKKSTEGNSSSSSKATTTPEYPII